uniref:Reverse transcriptase n=1 Tax=Cannabis sativa TaxID=3483 RepID=A0A803NNF1_CANSA
MILPKRLLRKVEAIYRAFLWMGDAVNTNAGLIAWDAICRPKSNGDLGFRNIQKWNVAAMGNKKCLKRIKEWLEWKVQTENILELLGKISKAKISKARKSILLTIIASVVYNLWQVRNEALWNQKVWQIKRTIKKIQQDALTRLMGALLSKMSIGDKTWLLKL